MVQVQPQDGQDQLQEAYGQFTAILGRPIKAVANFYSYYYLTEVRGEDQFSHDHFKIASNLQDSLYNYSIYASCMELTNTGLMLNINGLELEEVDRQKGERMRELVAYIDRNAEVPNLVREMLLGQQALSKNMNKERVKRAEIFERKYNAFSDSKKFLKAASFIFGHFGLVEDSIQDGTRGNIPQSEDIRIDKWGWEHNYGGPAWASVCNSALEYHNLGKTAFVDLMLSVEHNNGNFLNKIPMDNAEAEELLKEALPEPETPEERRIVDAVYDDKMALHQDTYNTILPLLLGMAREEEMLTLLKITAATDGNVSSWLRRNKETLK